MSVRSELFLADHPGALARADALDADTPPRAGVPALELAGVDSIDLETLGEIAARAVQYGHGELELQEVDLDHESLFELPEFLREVFVELGRAEDTDLPGEVAAEWAAGEDLAVTPAAAPALVASIIALVTAAAEAGAGAVYLWVGTGA